MKWYFKCLKQYVDFSGRARRKEYWMFYLFNVIVSLVLFFVDGLIGTKIHGVGIISSVYSLAVFLPGLAVTVRRLHDIGKSGWNYLWYILFFLIGSVIGSVLLIYLPVIGAILSIIFTVIVPIIFLVWMCKNSQPGDNKWGANPKMA